MGHTIIEPIPALAAMMEATTVIYVTPCKNHLSGHFESTDQCFVLQRLGWVGMTPWCIVLVCSWRCLLADRHSPPFPWSLSLHRRWCPSASHHRVTFLFLLALSFRLYFPFLSLRFSLHRPWCPSAPHHSFPFLSLGRLCQRSPRTCPVSLLCVESTQRKATAWAVGQVHPSGHPKPAVRYLSPTAAYGPWDVHLWSFPQRGHITTSCLQIPVLSPPFGEHITCPLPFPLRPCCMCCVSFPTRGMHGYGLWRVVSVVWWGVQGGGGGASS